MLPPTALLLGCAILAFGGMLAALLIPIHLFLFGLAFPLGWLPAPQYAELMSLIAHPIARIYLFVLCSLPLFHWAHRFRYFVFDLARLTYVGSIGLRVLVGLGNRVRADGYLAVCNVSAPIRTVFDLTKVSTLLRLFPTRADAVDAARSR